MKTIFKVMFLCWVITTALTCKKNADCHKKIIIKNNSNQSIIPSFKFINPDNKCILSGSTINSGEIFEDERKECWEIKISSSNYYELYIVDPSNYNSPNEFYSCDSIELRNTILKHYVLSLEDLKNNNFIITYP
jgi:hypothetical protein